MNFRYLLKQFMLLFALILLTNCGNKSADKNSKFTETLFIKVPEDSSKIFFNNEILENDSFNMVDFFYVYNGGGVAIGDLNNDQLPEIIFTGNMVEDALYQNKGNLKFEDISSSFRESKKGWSTGATMVDINHDGLLDIYICRSGNFPEQQRKNILYINQGDFKFKEEAAKYGLDDSSYSTQAIFFDYDKDGDLDMYLLNSTNELRSPNNVVPLKTDGTGLGNDRLYRNDEDKGNGIIFSDVTIASGITFDGFGLGVSVADINDDSWPDIFVTNDFLANDYLYINQQDGTFKNDAGNLLSHVSHFSMGNDVADFNNDGLYDLMTVDMRPADNFHEKKMSGPLNYNLFQRSLQFGYMPQYMRNTLQVNNGVTSEKKIKFSEVGQLAGIDATDWSWAPLFADFDNDGFKDLFITNGYLRDITDLDFINYSSSLSGEVSQDELDSILKLKAKKMPSIKIANYIFKNKQGANFLDMTNKWGMDVPTLSNGAAYADLDNDGDLDLVVNNINEKASVYENQSNKLNENNYLKVDLIGEKSNPKALGSVVNLYYNDSLQTLTQMVTRGYQSSVDYSLHFGLGKKKIVDSLIILWPDNGVQKFYDVEVNQNLVVRKENAAIETNSKNSIIKSAFFKEITDDLRITEEHNDTIYHDFNRTYLLPHKLSEQGPGIAVGDVNNDGFEDFFMGGGYSYSGKLLFGTESGEFKSQSLLRKDDDQIFHEDTGVLFFDYDNDGDLDLYVGSGSNEFYENSNYYQDRLYKNNGAGNFELTKGVLPVMKTSTSVVRAADFDNDGDLDLFIGGRLTPLKYPLPGKSYLLINEGDKFVNATRELAPSLEKVGMVTDGLWTDFDGDNDIDLIVVGEFMAIEFFELKDGGFKNVSAQTGLIHTAGWWNSINAGDFDNDGDIDYVLGNLGLNSKYQASDSEPISIYALDYDQNGTIDPIMTAYNEGHEYPVHSRDDLLKQIPKFKKKFPDYASYAKATINEVLSPQELSSAYQAKAFHLASSVLINEGNGKFKLQNLPDWAQIAPVYGIIIQDFDQDGYLDLVLSGNDFGTDVGLGRYDASRGLYLKGKGDGRFVSYSQVKSGLDLSGNTRGMATILANDNFVHIFGANNDQLRAYKLSDENQINQILQVPKESVKAIIKFKNGKSRLKEFYLGSGYLSQSTQNILLTDAIIEVMVFDKDGNAKKIF